MRFLHGKCCVYHSFPRNCCCAGEAGKKLAESQQSLSTLPYSNAAIQQIWSAFDWICFWSRFTICPADSCDNGTRRSKAGLVHCSNSFCYLRVYQTSAWESTVALTSQSWCLYGWLAEDLAAWQGVSGLIKMAWIWVRSMYYEQYLGSSHALDFLVSWGFFTQYLSSVMLAG